MEKIELARAEIMVAEKKLIVNESIGMLLYKIY